MKNEEYADVIVYSKARKIIQLLLYIDTIIKILYCVFFIVIVIYYLYIISIK